MVNSDDEVSLDYLLDPCFQIVNTHGAPLTSGWLEVYIHGTRTKYYCASDFDGTLHPFKIPLDSLGSNIVLADPNQAYDVYVYNKYGVLKMSRYNVKPGSGGSGSGQIVIDDRPISRIQVVSDVLDGPDWVNKSWKYALFEVEGDKLAWRQDGDNINLGQVYAKAGVYHYDFNIKVDWTGELRNEIVRFQILGINANDRDIWISFDLSYPHTEFYHFSCIATRQEGYEDRKFADLDISPYGGAPEGLRASVETLTIYSLDDAKTIVKDGGSSGIDKVYHDQTMTGDGTFENPLSISTIVGQLQDQIDCKQDELTPGTGISIINNVISCTASGTGPTYTAGNYVEITPENVINVSGLQPAGDYQPAGNYLTPEDLNGYATTEDVDEATSGKLDASAYRAPVQSDWNQTNSSALDYIKNKPTIPSLDGYATEQYVIEQTSGKLDASDYTAPVNADWNSEGGLSEILNKPDVAGLIPGQGITFTPDGDNYVISSTASGDVTKQYVDQAILSATSGKLDASDYTAPEQSDWNEADAADLAYIKNKPVEIGFIAGDGIRFEDLSSAIKISCSAQGGSTYTPGTGIDITNDVISVNSAVAMKSDIPAAQVQSDWTEADTEDPAFIKNKPSEYELVAGAGVSITPSGTNYIISSTGGGGGGGSTYTAGDGIDITGDVISVTSAVAKKSDLPDMSNYVQQDDLSSYATQQYVQNETSAFITSGDLPSEEEVDFEELDLSTYATQTYVASEVSGKQDQLTFTYDANDDIIGINGSGIGGTGGGSSYTAGTGIDITNDVISIDPAVVPSKTDLQSKLDTSAYVAPVNSDWTASAGLAQILNKPDTEEMDVQELSAGPGISINNGVISVSGQYLTQADLAGYATQTWVGQQGFLESSDLNGYATQEWVGQQGYLTSIPSSYATDTEVADAVAAGTSGKQNKLTDITDVQLVNALPASPVAGVLYLIPEA